MPPVVTMFRSSLLQCVAAFSAFGVTGAGASRGAAAAIPGVKRASIDGIIPLDLAEPGIAYAVHEVADPPAGVDWPQRLEDIGFLPGERVIVMACVQPGGDP